MKTFCDWLSDIAGKFSVVGLIGISSLSPLNAAPLPTAYGVWDRGEAQDPREFPFLRARPATHLGTSLSRNRAFTTGA